MFEILKDLFKPYNPKEYWENRGTEYVKEYKDGRRAFASPRPILDRTLVETIKSVQFNSIIEIGCNFGKNLKLVDDNFSGKEISGLDISSTALAEAKKFLNNDKITLYNYDANKTPFPDGKFDIVIVGEVFEHVPYEKFAPTMDEVSRIAKKYLVFIAPDHSRDPLFSKIVTAKHVFRYDYVKEFSSRKGLKLISQKPVDGNQIIYLVQKIPPF